MSVAVGPCEFTTDPLRHQMIETTPPLRFDNVQEPTLSIEDAISIAHQFFLVASGIIDFFDPPWLTDELSTWVADSSRREKPKSPIIYLALAIGLQGRARDEADDVIAEQCFGYGRQLAVFTLMDNPSLLTVQAFTLITYYMLAACRRNGAFTNLGVAVRAAYALGIHRHETNIAFVPEEGISRERAWKTLRVCDLFLSASMGRPPGTSETGCNIPWASLTPATDRENSTVPSQVFSAIFRICHIFERILVEVYSRRSVSLELAKSISRQHREWTEELPQTLRIDGLDGLDAVQSQGVSRPHGSIIVTMAYYYSIILLTRPFLTFKVCNSPKKGTQNRNASSSSAELTTYADACVDSAIKGVNSAYEIVFEENMPRRQPFVINSVFISAICLGLAYLDEYDRRGWPLRRSLERAIAILSHFGRLSPQSARYAEICQYLQGAAAIYIDTRDNTFLQSSSQLVCSVFGDVQNSAGTRSRVRSGGLPDLPTPQQSSFNALHYAAVVEPILPSSLDDNTVQQESIITPSGLLTGQYTNGNDYLYQDDSDLGVLPQDFFASHSVASSGNYSYGDDVPLFSLTNDLTSGDYAW